MRALWRKEWRGLLPLLPMFGLFFCADLVAVPLTKALDESDWFDHSGLDPDGIAPFALYLMGIIVGYSLFPREYEEKTIDFLHSLPITRGQVFLAKWLAGAALVTIVCLAQEVTYAFLQLFDGDSLTASSFRWENSGKLLLLGSATALEGLSHGLLLSFGRHFGFLLLGFAAWVVSRLEDHFVTLEYLSPLSVAKPVFYGEDLVIPWTPLLWHSILSLIALLLSFRLWSKSGHQGTYFALYRLKRWRKTVGCFTTLAVIVLVMLWVAGIDDDEEDPNPDPKPLHARVATKHYNFTYPANLQDRALRLAESADAIYEELALVFGGVKKSIIVADLTDRSREHLGLATLDKMRIDIFNNEEPDILKHTLAHETVHVLCFRLSGERGRVHETPLALMSEGTAEFLAFERGGSSRSRKDSRRHAVSMYHRHQLKFVDLVSDESARIHDDNFRYTLGELWVQALVDCYGKSSLGRIWRAVGRPNAPNIDNPVTFWQDTLQASGYSFEKVRSRWLKLLTELEQQEAELLKALPRPRGRVIKGSDGEYQLEIRCDKKVPENWPGLVLKVRARNGENYDIVRVEPTEDPQMYRADISWYGETFDYQIGIQFSDTAYPVYEEWKSPTRAGPPLKE